MVEFIPFHGDKDGRPINPYVSFKYVAFDFLFARSSGVAMVLLEQALAWAREQDYARCTVDFEAMNYLAKRFWTKWFRPICYSLVRRINVQTLKING